MQGWQVPKAALKLFPPLLNSGPPPLPPHTFLVEKETEGRKPVCILPPCSSPGLGAVSPGQQGSVALTAPQAPWA